MLKFKRGDKVMVEDNKGRPIEAIYHGLDYKKHPRVYRVKIQVPRARSRNGWKIENWYLLESRFVN